MPDCQHRLALNIRDAESLAEASDFLHDAYFGIDDAVYDEEGSSFRLLAWREVTEVSRWRRIIPFVYREETPGVRCALEFQSVQRATVEVTDRWGLGQYCLNEIQYDVSSQSLRFDVMGPLRLELVIESLRGQLQDIGQVTWDAPGWGMLRLSLKP